MHRIKLTAAYVAALFFIFASLAAGQTTAPIFGINPLNRGGVVSETRNPSLAPSAPQDLRPAPAGIAIQPNREYEFGCTNVTGCVLEWARFPQGPQLDYNTMPAVMPANPGAYNWEQFPVGPGDRGRAFAYDHRGWSYFRIVGYDGVRLATPVYIPVFFAVNGVFPSGGQNTPTISVNEPQQIVPGANVNFTFNLGNIQGAVFIVFGAFPNNAAFSIPVQIGQTEFVAPIGLPIGEHDGWLEVRGSSGVVRSTPFRIRVIPGLTLVGPSTFNVGSPLLISLVAPGVPTSAPARIRFEELRIGGGQTFEFETRIGERFIIPGSLPAGRYRVAYMVTAVSGGGFWSLPIEITLVGVGVPPSSCSFTANFGAVTAGRSGEVPSVTSADATSPQFMTQAGSRVPDGVMKTIYLDPDTDSPSLGYLPYSWPSGVNIVAAFAEIPGCGEVGQGFVVRARPASNYDNPDNGLPPLRLRPLTGENFVPGQTARFGIFSGDTRVTGVASAFVVTLGARNIQYMVREGNDFLTTLPAGFHAIFAWTQDGRWSLATFLHILR